MHCHQRHRADYIQYREYDFAEVVEYLDFAATDFLSIQDKALNEIKAAVFNTMLVAVADHGISSSQAVTRYTDVNESLI